MRDMYVNFPTRSYHLHKEKKENIIQECGLKLLAEKKSKTLVLIGPSGTGKTTLAKKICNYEHLNYTEQKCFRFSDLKDDRFPHKDLSELASDKIIEGHFVFSELSHTHFQRPFFPHDREIVYSRDYSSLELDENINLNPSIRDNFIFEFILPKPSVIKKLREKRYNQEKRKNQLRHTKYPYQNTKNIEQEEYLFWQAAYKLYKEGADVCIITKFGGIPLRFSE
ncbi:MAG: AAA family ATPase [Candidatus Pacearchaeota archaeon]|nr:AAA family ATPase [Candidatus Pacearchaeota archaeon]